MVTVASHQKLTRLLEMYLLKQMNGKLTGITYNLIALMPADPNSWVDRQTLLLSLPEVVGKSRRQLIHDLFTLLKQELPDEEYSAIYSIDLLQENSFSVQQLNTWEPQRDDTTLSVPINVIGGATSQYVTVIRSKVLARLTYYKPLKICLMNGHLIEGKLTFVQQLEADARLYFESDEGEQSCSFLDIASIQA